MSAKRSPQSYSSSSTRPHATASALVLVVDDFEDTLAMYAAYFGYAGLRVEVAHDGEEAIAKATELLPDVIVMDIAMPRVDGWEAMRQIRANPMTHHIPIVAHSAHSCPATRERALKAGCAFLPKPCLPETLLATVERLAAAKKL